MTRFDLNSLGNVFSTRYESVKTPQNSGNVSNVDDEIQSYFSKIKSSDNNEVSYADISQQKVKKAPLKNNIEGLPDIKEYRYVDLDHWQNLSDAYNPKTLKDNPFYMKEIEHVNGVAIINAIPDLKVIRGKRGKETAVMNYEYERIDKRVDKDGNTIISVYNSAASVDDLFSFTNEPVQYFVYNSNGALTQIVNADGTGYFRVYTY